MDFVVHVSDANTLCYSELTSEKLIWS